MDGGARGRRLRMLRVAARRSRRRDGRPPRPWTAGRMRRGSEILDAYHERVMDEKLSQVVTVQCAWCPDWTAHGTLRETNEAARQHRADHHPHIRPAKHRKRHRPGKLTFAKTSLDDNIAAAREQGAATWEG